MSVESKVLKGNIQQAIAEIEESKGSIDCNGHAPLAKGIKVLLEIQQAVIEERSSAKNSLKIGNITLTGTTTIALALAAYCVMKIHGAI